MKYLSVIVFSSIIKISFVFSSTSSLASTECLNFLSQSSQTELTLGVDQEVIALQAAEILFEHAMTSPSRKKVNHESQHQVNGYLIEVVTNFFIQNKKVPTANEIEALLSISLGQSAKGFFAQILTHGLDAYFQTDGAPNSIFEILQVAVNVARRSIFFPFKDQLRLDVMKFFASRLRTPSLLELAKLKNLDERVISLFIPNADSFIKKAIELNPDHINSVREIILAVYFRALSQKDLEESKRTQPTSPTYESLFLSLRASKILPDLSKDIERGIFTVDHLKILIDGHPEFSSFMRLSLFSGLKSLENTARLQRPGAFKNFIPAEVYNPERTTALLKAMKQKQGFLITSVNAGMPINEAMLITMLKFAREKNYDIVVIPTGGILDGLDSRLLEHSNIHILTHTVQNKFLRLWNIPVLPKNQNGLASLSNPKQHKPMQTTIVGHPTIQHYNVPTATNSSRHTSIWSTGSLSQNNYPYRHAVQGRTASLAKNQHTNGFLVLEKADGESGFDKEGVSNFWHTRPVYFTDDFKTLTKIAGFTDNGTKYFVTESDRYNLNSVKKVAAKIDTLVLGDLHERLSDSMFLNALVDYLKSHPEIKRIVLHDPIDGGSHNRHEAKSISLLRKKFAKGELDYHKEMMGLVQVINALTSIRPDLNIIVADSNHSYWGQQLLSGATEFQEIANGDFLSELRFAQRVYSFSDPLEYVLKYRNDFINNLPRHSQIEMLKTAILVENPNQVAVLGFGRNYVVGPEYRQTHVNFHGHQGANGAKPSPKSHAIGSESAITGDSHQSYILGNWMSVGTATALQVGYNDGGYSAWSNSFAVIYNDGSKQLFTYSSETGTFMAREAATSMTEEEFFGTEALEILMNDNDVVQGVIVDQNTHIINSLSNAGRRKDR